MPDIALEYRPISALLPYSGNPRTHPEEQIAKIVRSIQEFGWTNPVLVDGANGVIAGHGRLVAAKRLGIERIPVIELKGLSEAQKRAYIVADNKLALDGGWDLGLLRIELTALQSMNFDLSLTGFGEIDIGRILGPSGGLTDENDAPPLPETPVVRLGDVWTLDSHRLVCGDCTKAEDVAKALAGIKPHLMVTDPPYGVAYDAMWREGAERYRIGANRMATALAPSRKGHVFNDDRADWREAWALFPGSTAYVWHGALTAREVAESLDACGFKIRSQIIWNKTTMTMGRGDYHWKHEPCWYAVKGKGSYVGDRKQTTVWDIASPIHIMSGSDEEKTEHPTQKPAECMRRPMENNSSPGQAVYEPFCGSGTSIIAAETTGRQCLALEIDPGYCDVAILRWQSFSGKLATLDGKLFGDVGEERERKAKRVETVSHDDDPPRRRRSRVPAA